MPYNPRTTRLGKPRWEVAASKMRGYRIMTSKHSVLPQSGVF